MLTEDRSRADKVEFFTPRLTVVLPFYGSKIGFFLSIEKGLFRIFNGGIYVPNPIESVSVLLLFSTVADCFR